MLENEVVDNYNERRCQLVNKLLVATNEHLNVLISHALIVTDISMQIFLEEIPNILAEFTKYSESQKLRFNSLVDKAKSASKKKAKHGNEVAVLGTEEVEFSDFIAKSTISNLKILAKLHEKEINTFQTSISLIISTLDSIFIAANKKDINKAINKLNKFLLGLTPIGPVIELFKTISEISSTYSIDEKKANETLNFIVEYTEKCYYWNILAQIILEYHKRQIRNEKEKICDEEMAKLAASIIQNRFRSHLERLNKRKA